MGDDQKILKKRLKVLMNRPENQVCADCPERQPRWASLIVVPPGAPPGQQPIGAFVCLECSGSHRRLGVHIAFVRSINLDSWKEKEVLAMENGGNARVNFVFEGALSNPTIKPHNHADGPTRERFIRDKYERRKYYDPNGFSVTVVSTGPSSSSSAPSSGNSNGRSNVDASVGPPSDVARQRLEERRQRIKSSTDNYERSSSSINPTTALPARKGGRTAIAKAPASAPLSVDLLDFGSTTNNIDSIATSVSQTDDFFGPTSTATTTTTGITTTTIDNSFEANFSSDPAPTTSIPTRSNGTGIDMFAFLTQDMKKEETQQPAQPQNSKPSFGGDIMSLYGPTANQQHQPQTFANPGMTTISSSMAGMNFDAVNATTGQNMGMHGYGGPNVQQQQNQQQQQQQMMMMMQRQQQQQNNQMMYNGGNTNMMMMQQQQGGNGMMMMNQHGTGGGMGGYPMGMQNQGGMNNNPMMMMQQQQQQQQQQFPSMTGYGANSGFNTNGNTTFGSPMGVFPTTGTTTFTQQQNSNLTNFGNGTSAAAAKKQQQPQVPEKEDPFAQFGINVFRT